MRRSAGIVTRSFSTAVPARPSPHAHVPPGVATNQPTAAFRRHHDVVEPQVDQHSFRQGWRVSTRLDSLLESNRISREQWGFGHEWLRWAETVTPYRAQSWDARVDVSTVPNDAGMLIRTKAATRLRETAAALGELRVRILEAVLVKDMPWTQLGTLLRLSDKAARDWAVETLEALADHCAGRPVAPPPGFRFRNQPGSL